MSIQNIAIEDRPREKLLNMGPSALSDAELLAIILRTGIRGKSAIELSKELLHTFGGLRGLLKTSQEAFCRIPGLGPAKYAQLQATMEIIRRHLEERLSRGQQLGDPALIREFLRLELRDQSREIVAALFLDLHYRVIECKHLFYGTLAEAELHPREVVKEAMRLNAAKVIIAHNHPSGDPTPSSADIEITELLRNALALVDVHLLDHYIVGDYDITSLAERGFLQPRGTV